MAEYLAPGVYAEEFDTGVKAMEGVGTSTAGFVGLAARGPVVGGPVLITSFADYKRRFGGYLSEPEYGGYRYLPNCVEQFFVNGGSTCYVMRVALENAVAAKARTDLLLWTPAHGQYHAGACNPDSPVQNPDSVHPG